MIKKTVKFALDSRNEDSVEVGYHSNRKTNKT